MKSILVPTDFSSYAQHALNFASQLAKARSMQIKVLHVVEQASAPYMTAVSTGLSDQLGNVFVLRRLEKAKSHLETLMAQLNKEGITSSYQIKIGNPYQNISAQIKHESCDLIVMGTHGTTGMEEMILGSNSEKVVRKASCPVITIKEATSLEDINDMVVAVDPLEPAFKHTQLRELQDLFSARLHLVSVSTPGNFIKERDGLSKLSEFARSGNLHDYRISMYSDVTEEEGIRHYAEDQGADIIAMATHGRSGLGHLLAGSISEQMVNHAIIPVVTVPYKSKIKNPVKDVVL
jgi:nucleotide-binding universal stress UspA family protein